MEYSVRNPLKDMAMHLAHAKSDQKRLNEVTLPEGQVAAIRAHLTDVIDEICKRDYDIQTILRLAEEYEKLSLEEWLEWIKE
jgi:hypothetical protein